jgi:hypothetical protein
VDLRCRIYALKCTDDSNVKTHIQSLVSLYEQLKGMGEIISDGDFMTLILASLPKSYTISLQNHANPQALDPRIVTETILEEFDRLQIEESQSKEAENAMTAKGGKGKGKRKKENNTTSRKPINPDIDCWGCGEKGHIKTKRPKKPKKKPNGNQGKDQAVHTSQPQEDYTFSSHIIGEAMSRTTADTSGITIYDSGATTHMSPSRGKFVDFMSIEPKAVKGADKTIFMATGIGRMKIDLPNGNETTSVTLRDALY